MMQLFITGGTGVIGRRLVPRLVADGHHVGVLSRSTANEAQITAMGAEPVLGNLFDPAFLKSAVAGCDAVVHAATKIPPILQGLRSKAWAENDRIRTTGTALLVDAALANDVPRVVLQSISFTYQDAGAAWIDEDHPVVGRGALLSMLQAERELHRFAGSGGTAVTLRCAAFYSADSEQTQLFLKLARRGVSPIPGEPASYFTQIHVDDVATAFSAALGAPGGVYNVAEDHPLTRREADVALAVATSRHRLRRVPAPLVKAAGRRMEYLLRSQRVSNARFKRATSWRPAFADMTTGLTEVLEHAS